MKVFVTVLLSVLLTKSMAVDFAAPNVVRTTEGQVQGDLADDGDYYAYYGIRYGADTSGENRFKVHFCHRITTNGIFTCNWTKLMSISQ